MFSLAIECGTFAFVLYYVKGIWQYVKCLFIDIQIKANLMSGNTVCVSCTSQPLVSVKLKHYFCLSGDYSERPSPKCLFSVLLAFLKEIVVTCKVSKWA